VARSCGVARCGRAHRLKVNFVDWKVARTCRVARGGRAGLLQGGLVFLEVARSCDCGTGWPCFLSILTRLEFCEGCVWAILVVFVFGDVFG